MNQQENIKQTAPKIKKKRKRNFINGIVMFWNHVAAISLLIAYLAPYVSPENFWLIAFFGLAYPVLVVINLLFVIYWGAQLKKRAFYSLLILIAGFTNLQGYLQFGFNSSAEKSKKMIKLISYNVKLFDLYNWTHNLETRSKIFNLIKDESPDIACYQEFFTRDSSKLNNLDSLLSVQKALYVHTEYSSTINKVNHWGIATFSRYPIIGKGKINFGYKSNNTCIYTDVKIDTDTIRVYNMHLQSIAFENSDYKYIADLQEDVENENMEQSKNILKRLKLAFVKRSRQADLIAESIANSPYKVIVCGDFNDTPASYSYNCISANLKDSFIESGTGFGRSYIGAFPSFRIDYILHSPQFNAYNYRTIRDQLSDHFPISCYLEKQ